MAASGTSAMNQAAGLILAGGLSERFGAEKAAALLDGRPLLHHAADRMAGVAALAVSAPADSQAAALASAMGAHLVSDDPAGPRGPLAGVLAGLRWAREGGHAYLAVSPCDTPLLPRDMFAVLFDGLGDAIAAHAITSGGPHPLCSLWRTSALEATAAALAGGSHPSAQGLLADLGARQVRFADARAFANANTPEELALMGGKDAS